MEAATEPGGAAVLALLIAQDVKPVKERETTATTFEAAVEPGVPFSVREATESETLLGVPGDVTTFLPPSVIGGRVEVVERGWVQWYKRIFM